MSISFPTIRRFALAFTLLLGAPFTAACAGSSEYMREVPSAPPIAAPADKATVVFVRPSNLAFKINFAILDQNGNWMGDAVAEKHFAVTLPPGEYMFVGWAENTAALKATLAAGRVYYVEVEAEMGAFSAQVALEALTPRNEDYKDLSKWLHETDRLEPLPSGAAYIQGRRDDALKRVASARENWDGYSNEDKEKRTLRAEDGVVPAAPGSPGVAAR
jgi:hypothetical protein